MGKHRWPTTGDEEAPPLHLPPSSQRGVFQDEDGDHPYPARAVDALPGAPGGSRIRTDGQEAQPGSGVRWRVSRSAALVFLGVALAVGAALFLVRSSEPSAAAVSVQLDAEAPDGPAAGGDGSAGGGSGGGRTVVQDQKQVEVRNEVQAGAAPAGRPAGTPGGESGAASAGAARVEIIVYVTGAVAAPGVVTVADGTRVFEVLEKAGGALPEADLEGINLAATPSDGQHIHLHAVGEEPRAGAAGPGVPAAAPSGQPPASGGNPGGTGASDEPATIDINTATLADIESLPRVGPVLGQRIIDWREEHGPFAQASDIDAVPGIGPAMLEGILPLIVVQ